MFFLGKCLNTSEPVTKALVMLLVRAVGDTDPLADKCCDFRTVPRQLV
jgi:hypothetical protein